MRWGATYLFRSGHGLRRGQAGKMVQLRFYLILLQVRQIGNEARNIIHKRSSTPFALQIKIIRGMNPFRIQKRC